MTAVNAENETFRERMKRNSLIHYYRNTCNMTREEYKEKQQHEKSDTHYILDEPTQFNGNTKCINSFITSIESQT